MMPETVDQGQNGKLSFGRRSIHEVNEVGAWVTRCLIGFLLFPNLHPDPLAVPQGQLMLTHLPGADFKRNALWFGDGARRLSR
jgi:hypothetical protein